MQDEAPHVPVPKGSMVVSVVDHANDEADVRSVHHRTFAAGTFSSGDTGATRARKF